MWGVWKGFLSVTHARCPQNTASPSHGKNFFVRAHFHEERWLSLGRKDRGATRILEGQGSIVKKGHICPYLWVRDFLGCT